MIAGNVKDGQSGDKVTIKKINILELLVILSSVPRMPCPRTVEFLGLFIVWVMNCRLSLMMPVLAVLSFSAVSCGQDYRTVGNERFRQMTADTAAVIVDVRTPEEYYASHIPGAINIDVKSPDFLQHSMRDLENSTPVAVYCRSGARSRDAARVLAASGYTVCNLRSGILGWDGPLESGGSGQEK